MKIEICLKFAVFVCLINLMACAKPDTHRTAIKSNGKGKATKLEDFPKKNDHVDLVAIQSLLSSANPEATRFFTESVILSENEKPLSMGSEEDIKLLALVLNQGHPTRLFFYTNTMSTHLNSPEGSDLFNAVAQTEDSVTFRGLDNNLKVLKITSKKKVPASIELQGDSEIRFYQFLGPQKIRVTRKVPLRNFGFCGTVKNLTVTTVYQLQTLVGEQTEARVNGSLLKVFANHLAISDTMRSQLSPPIPGPAKNHDGQKPALGNRDLSAGGRISISTDLLQFFINRASPGQLTHLECQAH